MNWNELINIISWIDSIVFYAIVILSIWYIWKARALLRRKNDTLAMQITSESGKKRSPTTGILAGIIAYVINIVSFYVPWWYWNGELFFINTSLNVHASANVFLQGIEKTFSIGGYSLSSFLEWGGPSPESIASAIQPDLMLFYISGILILIGTFLAGRAYLNIDSKGKRMGSILIALGSIVCLLVLLLFAAQLVSLAGGNALLGTFEFTSDIVGISTKMQWGIYIGPFLIGLSSLIGFVAAQANYTAGALHRIEQKLGTLPESTSPKPVSSAVLVVAVVILMLSLSSLVLATTLYAQGDEVDAGYLLLLGFVGIGIFSYLLFIWRRRKRRQVSAHAI